MENRKKIYMAGIVITCMLSVLITAQAVLADGFPLKETEEPFMAVQDTDTAGKIDDATNAGADAVTVKVVGKITGSEETEAVISSDGNATDYTVDSLIEHIATQHDRCCVFLFISDADESMIQSCVKAVTGNSYEEKTVLMLESEALTIEEMTDIIRKLREQAPLIKTGISLEGFLPYFFGEDGIAESADEVASFVNYIFNGAYPLLSSVLCIGLPADKLVACADLYAGFTENFHSVMTDSSPLAVCVYGIAGYKDLLSALGADVIVVDELPGQASEELAPEGERAADMGSLYYVVFKSDHGRVPDVEQAAAGSTINMPKDLTEDGYVFTGWYMDEACTVPYDFDTPVTDNLELYAGWTDDGTRTDVYHTVSFDANGHGTAPDPQYVLEGESAYRPGDMYEEGYFFRGWYMDPETQYPFSFSIPVNMDITVYAGWEKDIEMPEYFYVYFDAQGVADSPEQQVVEKGKQIYRPDDPISSNYVFAGWYTDLELTQAYDFESPVTNNFTLYACWEEKPEEEPYYIITFDCMGFGEAPDPQYIQKGGYVKEPAEENDGVFYFTGWYLDEELTQAYDFAVPVDSDLSLYAGWTTHPVYTLSFDMQGHGITPTSQAVPEGMLPSYPEDPQEDGYTFTGWYAGSGTTELFDFAAPLYGSTTIYAGWEELQGEGQETDEQPMDIQESGEPLLKETELELQGDPDEKEIKKYLVTFARNGHGQEIMPEEVEEGAVAKRLDDPKEEGFIFIGWMKETDGQWKMYDFSLPVTSDLHLVAWWEEDAIIKTDQADDLNLQGEASEETGEEEPETMTQAPVCNVQFFMGGHGTAPEAQMIQKGGTVRKPDDPEERYYTFKGWYTDASYTDEYDFNVPVSGDLVLYAKWTADYPDIDYTVSFVSDSIVISKQYVHAGNVASVPGDLSKNGYEFDGWFKDPELAEQYDFTAPVTGNMQLYAKWNVHSENEPPKTDDSSGLFLWVAIFGAALIGTPVMALINRNRCRQ